METKETPFSGAEPLCLIQYGKNHRDDSNMSLLAVIRNGTQNIKFWTELR